MKQLYEIILASGSPRRRELLSQAGLRFLVRTTDVDETPTETEPAKVVEELSRRKAGAVAAMLGAEVAEATGETPDRMEVTGKEAVDAAAGGITGFSENAPQLVVAADTIVALDGEILGKPKDAADAVRMLRELSGRTHEVYTGVTIRRMGTAAPGLNTARGGSAGAWGRMGTAVPGYNTAGAGSAGAGFPETVVFSACTRVTFYPLTEAEILDYVASGEPLDKAGSYGIQGIGERLVERIEGDYNNVVGFPLSAFLRILAEYGGISYGDGRK